MCRLCPPQHAFLPAIRHVFGPNIPQADMGARIVAESSTSTDGLARNAIRPPVGMLLVGHGTRDLSGRGEFLKLAQLLAERCSHVAVEPCFLELAEPTIADAWRRLSERASGPLVATQAILFAAGHAKRDIPEALADAAGRAVPLASHLGLHPRLVERARQSACQALDGLAPLPPARQLLLAVGRGSSDAAATSEMYAFSRLRHQPELFSATETAFVVKASPGLEEAVERIHELPVERIVVQPHLLFSGRVFDQVRAVVEQACQRSARQQWIVAQPLGPSPLVVDAICGRFTELVANLEFLI